MWIDVNNRNPIFVKKEREEKDERRETVKRPISSKFQATGTS